MPTAGDEKLWVSKAFAHASLRMTAQNFDDRIRPKMPAESVRGNRQTLRFFLPDVFETWASLRKESKPVPKETDPLLDGGDSPGLERYRNAKADLAEMERDERRGKVIPSDEILPSLQQAAGAMRQAIEHAVRLYGNPVGELLNEALTETEQAWEKAIEGNAVANLPVVPAGSGNDQDAAIAVNA